jgi:hypothetical protein
MEENITVAVRVRPLDASERQTQRELWKVDNESISCSEDKKSISFQFGKRGKFWENSYFQITCMDRKIRVQRRFMRKWVKI